MDATKGRRCRPKATSPDTPEHSARSGGWAYHIGYACGRITRIVRGAASSIRRGFHAGCAPDEP